MSLYNRIREQQHRVHSTQCPVVFHRQERGGMKMSCSETYRPYGATAPLVCERETEGRHIGRHYAYEEQLGWRRLWTWSEGGASGLSQGGTERATPCTECGTPHDGGGTETVCFFCRLWSARVKAYADEQSAKQFFIRPHNDEGFFHSKPYLYCWAEGTHGAFGNRACLVRTDSGHEFGPSDSLWGSGEIPWWLVDKFPPNGVILFNTIPGFKD